MMTKPTAPSAARKTDSTNPDAAFFDLHRKWRSAQKDTAKARAALDRAEDRVRRKLPKMPPLACALGFSDREVLSLLKSNLDHIEQHARILGDLPLPADQQAQLKAGRKLLPALRARVDGWYSVHKYPDVKPAMEAWLAACNRERQLLANMLHMRVTTPEAIALKVQELAADHMQDGDEQRRWPDRKGDPEEQRWAHSILRDLRGMGRVSA